MPCFGALPGLLVVFGQDRRQLELLEMVAKQDLGIGDLCRVWVLPRSCRRPFDQSRIAGGPCRLHIGAWQMRIGIEIETWRATLDAGNGNLLDGIEADRAEPDRLSDGARNEILFEHLHQAQDLDELPLALVARCAAPATGADDRTVPADPNPATARPDPVRPAFVRAAPDSAADRTRRHRAHSCAGDARSLRCPTGSQPHRQSP